MMLLDKLEGMWAFGIYDEDDGSLTFAEIDLRKAVIHL